MKTLEQWQAVGEEHSRSIHGNDEIHADCPECRRIAKAQLESIGIPLGVYKKYAKKSGMFEAIAIIEEIEADDKAEVKYPWTRRRLK